MAPYRILMSNRVLTTSGGPQAIKSDCHGRSRRSGSDRPADYRDTVMICSVSETRTGDAKKPGRPPETQWAGERHNRAGLACRHISKE